MKRLIDRRQDAFEQAVSKVFGQEEHSVRLRLIEAERRVGELEQRLAKLEGKR